MTIINLSLGQADAVMKSIVLEDQISSDVKDTLRVFLQKLTENARSTGKRSRERSLEEALQILQKIPKEALHSLQSAALHQFAQLLLALQLEAVAISSACRKLDQILQVLAEINYSIVFKEIKQYLQNFLHQKQVFTLKDLQIACMFLEDSTMGRAVLKTECTTLLGKVAELIPVVMSEEEARNEPLCYQTVKVCLQVFQLLPRQVALLVHSKDSVNMSVREILEFLMSIILGEVSSRDSRLLAGTAVAMLLGTLSDSQCAGSAAWSLLQITNTEPWRWTVGELQVDCRPRRQDGVDRLAVCRGLLTCCRNDILVSRHGNQGTCFLLNGLFPFISALCEEKLDCHYYVFQVFSIWLKRLKECLSEVWEVTGAPLDSDLQQHLTQIIWSNAESPLDGVAEVARSAFCLLMEIYEKDCSHFGNTEKRLYVELLNRISELPWESKAKYLLLTAVIPYTGTDKVLELYPALPSHILKCLSNNHLSPCASEVYKFLLQEQKRELFINASREPPPTDQDLANQWALRWQPVILEALTSELSLLQNNASCHLLPSTLRVFPGAFYSMLSALDPTAPGHLHAWACVMSAQRVTSGHSLWGADSPHALNTLHLALSSLDDSVRLAALNLLCCSPKTKEAPSQVEYSSLRDFIPLNLNSESSPFRQHLQAALRKFLVRIRDSCMASVKGHASKKGLTEEEDAKLKEGVEFVDWLSQLSLVYLTPDSSYQRKKTVLLLMSAVLETCTDTWSPDRKKGQPPANMSTLINWAKVRGKWDFFSKSNLLVLIGCLEDSTNEIRELSAELLLRFFPPSLPDDVTAVLFSRAERLLQSPRVQEAQMGALMIKLLLQKVDRAFEQGEKQSVKLITFLLTKLQHHYITARNDMLLAARTTPIHGIVSALQRGLLEVPEVLVESITHSIAGDIVSLLEKLTLLLLGVLYGDQDTEEKDVLPSFCDMGNAISSLIGQGGVEGAGLDEDGEENVLLSEEHSLVLTCCWVSLKEIGIFLGSLVERILSLHCKELALTEGELRMASKVFKDIILKCRHWGAVEGCCIGFTKFCRALLCSSDPEIKEIPPLILQQGLSVLQSPRSTSVTRRAAGLPMLILGVLAAEDSSKSRPLLAYTINTLLYTAKSPLPKDWDQTLDLPQVCAVHTLQALVKGSSLGVAVLQYTPVVAVLSLTLLSSPCWAMRNAALQLYSSLCTRMLGQQLAGGEGSTHSGMSSPSFFNLYPALQPFLQGALESAAKDLHDSTLLLHPSLYPVLTLLAKLQPGAEEQTRALSEFLPPLFLLATSPVYGVRVMSSRALVAMVPLSEYLATVLQLVEKLPESQDVVCCHNRVHGQLLQIEAVLTRALQTNTQSSLSEVVTRFESRLWLASSRQRCPLVRLAYVDIVRLMRGHCSGAFLSQLSSQLLQEIHRTPNILEVGSATFHQSAVNFLCGDPEWACQVWQSLADGNAVVRLSLVKSAIEGRGWRGTDLQQVIERALQANLKKALLEQNVEYRGAFLTAFVEVMAPDEESFALPRTSPPKLEEIWLQECVEVLFTDLESDRGGPVLISTALCAVSLLLSQSVDLSLLLRWCKLLEKHRCPEAPEALRISCAQALCLCGVSVVTRSLTDSLMLTELSTSLISTGIYLLQDESPQVRAKAAVFASLLCCSRRPEAPRRCFYMQVNQAMRSLLDLLLEEFWDSSGALEALVCHLPDCDLNVLLKETKETQCRSLYERDEANVYAEPSVISECLLPYLLHLVKHYPESSTLTKNLEHWARNTAAIVNENLTICMQLQLGNVLNPDWLSLLIDPRFHGALYGLFSRAIVLLQLLKKCDSIRPLLDPLSLSTDLQDIQRRFVLNGVFLPQVFIDALRTD
ncbi:thyroid adenoma-associated protein homolog isoform X2 [Rhinichthys klamathensis goyatoka]|uniref:thyroid adenoma-associated protein homolog isoform X2 n=1 Tax=Rhinichthys klamathensis goyatoka TaxID=3034132 RepID=UPI0024B55AFE|nr:thyroid adenoma-associated protein homolog isoform X2 [Rhinichthys klamathensis goyatoka]